MLSAQKAAPAPPTNDQPFAQLKIGRGLYGVTKVQWRDWPSRSWLSWLIAGLFVAAGFGLACLTARTGIAEPRWHAVLRYVLTVGLAVVVVGRLIMEGTVSRTPPGQVPKWDRRLLDPWWTPIHTGTGVVLGCWLVPLLVTVALTTLWEVLEITVPGYGDEEINGNRLLDMGVAWLGWLLAAAVSALAAGQPVPLW
ncbi:hypothetical protein GCM10020358_60100 [Amorphoplanes nipponensis]|uniref:Uncharacterized protein n=1 Tax=Actinoplanes nipponensis TaxID=135950 RepID=A0A919JCA3_9ACTN|nr:hypothetical protein [Actinoplanes nipponensis]GIE47183.1 hypothetical protein Ani05nite_07170 [Actinoplanes nipponensis]